MKAHRADFPIRAMCRVLELSSSGYYDWLKRRPSARAIEDERLGAKIREIWVDSRKTYGRPRVHKALRAAGEQVGTRRVARLMRKEGIAGVTRRRGKSAAPGREDKGRPAPDLVDRDFSVDGPDRLWVADITHVRTGVGWLYLAVVVDAWSRRVVGWAMKTHLRAGLVTDALAMAIARRQPTGEVIHHSDQGSQYTSLGFGQRCREAGVVQSMGSVGDAYDNAMCESFFATLECELLDRKRFEKASDARREIFRFIEGFYNTRRLHSALDYQTPAQYEARHISAVPSKRVAGGEEQGGSEDAALAGCGRSGETAVRSAAVRGSAG